MNQTSSGRCDDLRGRFPKHISDSHMPDVGDAGRLPQEPSSPIQNVHACAALVSDYHLVGSITRHHITRPDVVDTGRSGISPQRLAVTGVRAQIAGPET